MKLLRPVVCLFITVLCISCGTGKTVIKYITKDSTAVHYKDSTIYRDSVVYVTVPKESEGVVIPFDYKSHLETSIAESDAWVDTVGWLHHTLTNKHRESIPVIVQNTTHIKDVAHVSSKNEGIIKPVYIEKKLNWWQKFQMKSFWWILGVLIIENVLIIFAINKRFIYKI